VPVAGEQTTAVELGHPAKPLGLQLLDPPVQLVEVLLDPGVREVAQ
jgi:hypothetical protein